MRLVHVLLLAETLPDAERLASAWHAAAPHAVPVVVLTGRSQVLSLIHI